jgi:hypothetical protein
VLRTMPSAALRALAFQFTLHRLDSLLYCFVKAPALGLGDLLYILPEARRGEEQDLLGAPALQQRHVVSESRSISRELCFCRVRGNITFSYLVLAFLSHKDN